MGQMLRVREAPGGILRMMVWQGARDNKRRRGRVLSFTTPDPSLSWKLLRFVGEEGKVSRPDTHLHLEQRLLMCHSRTEPENTRRSAGWRLEKRRLCEIPSPGKMEGRASK